MGLSHGRRGPRAGQHGRNAQAEGPGGRVDSPCNRTPAGVSFSTSLKLFHHLRHEKKIIIIHFAVKIKQDSSRPTTGSQQKVSIGGIKSHGSVGGDVIGGKGALQREGGSFPSWCKEELTAGSCSPM